MAAVDPLVAAVRAADTDEAKAAAVLRWVRDNADLLFEHASVWGQLSDLADELDKPSCNGACMTGADVGVPSAAIAYAHPDCPLHG